MKKVLLALMLAAPVASADGPRQLSQHPRTGELAQLPFSIGSTRLSADLAHKLGEIAGWAADNPDGTLVIERSNGDPALAQRRAEAVRDQLVDLGVEEDRIAIAVPRTAPQRTIVIVASRRTVTAQR